MLTSYWFTECPRTPTSSVPSATNSLTSSTGRGWAASRSSDTLMSTSCREREMSDYIYILWWIETGDIKSIREINTRERLGNISEKEKIVRTDREQSASHYKEENSLVNSETKIKVTVHNTMPFPMWYILNQTAFHLCTWSSFQT